MSQFDYENVFKFEVLTISWKGVSSIIYEIQNGHKR